MWIHGTIFSVKCPRFQQYCSCIKTLSFCSKYDIYGFISKPMRSESIKLLDKQKMFVHPFQWDRWDMCGDGLDSIHKDRWDDKFMR